MTLEETKKRLETEEDFIALKRCNYSISALLAKYDEREIPTAVVAQALMMTEEEVEQHYADIVVKLQIALDITR